MTTATLTLTDFLLARIAEDEAAAQAAMIDAWGEEVGTPRSFDWSSLALGNERDTTPAQDDHIARWDPARVLAECAAKRAIVERYRGNWAVLGRAEGPVAFDVAYTDEQVTESNELEKVLRLLALPYAEHSDYRDEWSV